MNESPDDILNRRLKLGEKIVYPFTVFSNVIGLQGTILEKMPISSPTRPTEVVDRQVWLDTSNSEEGEEEDIGLGMAQGDFHEHGIEVAHSLEDNGFETIIEDDGFEEEPNEDENSNSEEEGD